MSLHLILGPEFSGKTTELIRNGTRYAAIKWNIYYILHTRRLHVPRRYGGISQEICNVRYTSDLNDVTDEICLNREIRVILMDDAHLWKMDAFLRKTIKRWIQCGKIIYAAGLDINAEGELSRDFLQWIPLCDSIQKIHGLIQSSPYHFKDAGGGLPELERGREINQITRDNRNHRITDMCVYNGRGELHLIIGPMFSGKTTELLRQGNRYWYSGCNILYINHVLNNRYGTTDICSHSGIKISQKDQNVMTIRASSLEDAYNCIMADKWNQIEAIFIEEGQFFPDLITCVPNWIGEGKHVYVCGLDGDAKQEPFGQLLELIPLAKSVVKKLALCQQCCDGTVAPFTRRIIYTTTRIEIGSDDIYRAVCRKHICDEIDY